MANTTARIRHKGQEYEILVDLDAAVKFKKSGSGNIAEIMQTEDIYNNLKKGDKASNAQLETTFGTNDIYVIAEKILKDGEIMLTQEYRDEEREKKLKQVIDYLVVNSVDPKNGRPHTPDRIKSALEQIHFNLTNRPVEEQVKLVIDKLNSIMPISIQTKKIKITIPAAYTGKAYGVIQTYKESEEWLSDGSLEVILAIPSGAVMGFFDKLNGVTHGSALSEEIKE
jgi:ribosome maturation protein SDO1